MLSRTLTFILLLSIALASGTNKYYEVMRSPKIGILAIKNQHEQGDSLSERLKAHIEQSRHLTDLYEVFETNCNELLDFCDLEGITKEDNLLIQPRFTCPNKIGEDVALNLPRVFDKISELQAHSDKDQSGVHLLFNYPGADEVARSKIRAAIIYLEKRLVSNVSSYTLVFEEDSNLIAGVELNTEESYIIVNGKPESLSFGDLKELNLNIVVDEVNRYLVAEVEDLAQESLCRIFASGIQNKIYLIEKSEECPDLKAAFKQAALHNIKYDMFKDRLQFVAANLNAKDYGNVSQVIRRHLGDDILESKHCDVLIIGYKRGDYIKFRLDEPQEATAEKLTAFVEGFNANELETRYIKSERLTVPNQVVAHDFRDKIIRPDNDVFLLICEQKDKACDILTSFCDFMTKRSTADADFYFLDYSRNDIEHLSTRVFPMFLAYKRGKKKAPEMFRVDFSYEALVEFFNKHIGEFVFGDPEKIEFLTYIKDFIPEGDRIKLEALFSAGALTEEL